MKKYIYIQKHYHEIKPTIVNSALRKEENKKDYILQELEKEGRKEGRKEEIKRKKERKKEREKAERMRKREVCNRRRKVKEIYRGTNIINLGEREKENSEVCEGM